MTACGKFTIPKVGMIAPKSKCAIPLAERLAVPFGFGRTIPMKLTKGDCMIQPRMAIKNGGTSHKMPWTGVGMSNPFSVTLAPSKMTEGR